MSSVFYDLLIRAYVREAVYKRPARHILQADHFPDFTADEFLQMSNRVRDNLTPE